MTRDHSTIEELLAVQALGGLDGDDVGLLARLRADHGDCEECRRLEADFEETAGGLAFTLDPAPVDAGMADRILAHAQGLSSPPTQDPDALATRREGKGARRWQVVVGLAAAFVLLVGAVAVFFGPGRSVGITGASPEQTVVRFRAGPGVSGEMALAYAPGGTDALLWGSDLADPGQDQVYEIWLIHNGVPVSAGCVAPTGGQIVHAVNADVSTADLMAVTTESKDCPAAPTSQPVMTAPLQV